MRYRLLRILLAVLVIAVSTCAGGPCAALAQTSQRSGWSSNDVLREFKLVSPGSGWATTGPGQYGGAFTRLYWTDDNGQTWRDITPQDMAARRIWQIFFVDRSHGWLLSTETLEPEENARFYLLSTEDGAKHWQTLQIQRATFNLIDEGNIRYLPTHLFFVDSKHGWMLWHWQLPLFWRDVLLGTSDGGRNWARLDDPPGSGPLQFVSAEDGWIAGVSEDPESFGAPEDTHLWHTHDGGWNSKPVPMPIPKNSAEEGFYLIALRFGNTREGMVAVALKNGLVTFGFCELSYAGRRQDMAVLPVQRFGGLSSDRRPAHLLVRTQPCREEHASKRKRSYFVHATRWAILLPRRLFYESRLPGRLKCVGSISGWIPVPAPIHNRRR